MVCICVVEKGLLKRPQKLHAYSMHGATVYTTSNLLPRVQTK